MLRFILVLVALVFTAEAFDVSQGHIGFVASTVPANGDLNPYGVFVIPTSNGALKQGNILVSNFNNNGNQAGRGSTIVQVDSNTGEVTQFAQIDAAGLVCPGGIGLTTALVVLQRGWVIVGSLPTTDGSPQTIGDGCLIILDSNGKVVETLNGGDIKGPWDAAVNDQGATAYLFVTNVLNGPVTKFPFNVINQGNVIRIKLNVPEQGGGKIKIVSTTVIASGFSQLANPAVLVSGPTGLGYGRDDTLYVADTLNNRIVSITKATTRTSSAGTGTLFSRFALLNGPLGLAIAQDGNVLVANGNDGVLIEIDYQTGTQIAFRNLQELDVDIGNGALFGIAVVDDATIWLVNDAENDIFQYFVSDASSISAFWVGPIMQLLTIFA